MPLASATRPPLSSWPTFDSYRECIRRLRRQEKQPRQPPPNPASSSVDGSGAATGSSRGWAPVTGARRGWAPVLKVQSWSSVAVAVLLEGVQEYCKLNVTEKL